MNAERRRRVGRRSSARPTSARCRARARAPRLRARAPRRRARCAPARTGSRSGWGCACGASRSTPSGPTVNASSASPTSLRCQWRTFVASRSMPAATSASAAKYAACRSRATTCVATVSGSRPSAASACFSMAGERCAYVPTAPAILPTAISRRAACEPRATARHLRVVPGEREAEGDRLGEDAVAAADHRRLARARARDRASAARRRVAAATSSLSAASRSSDRERRCRGRRSTSSRGGASAPRGRRAPRRA